MLNLLLCVTYRRCMYKKYINIYNRRPLHTAQRFFSLVLPVPIHTLVALEEIYKILPLNIFKSMFSKCIKLTYWFWSKSEILSHGHSFKPTVI